MKKILIIDDEKSIRLTYQYFLENEGYDVTVLDNAGKAIELIQESQFDLLITDCIMPNISGIELLEKLRESNYAIAVVIMTGEPKEADRLKSIKLHASAYLAKPIDKTLLIDTVNSILK